MPEVDLDFPRAYVEFTNPDDVDEVFKCDLTWLTSRWSCIFGAGCEGIYAHSPDVGCCTLGAHFADDADHERVAAWVERLTPEQWENHDEGRRNGWTERDADGELKTRAIERHRNSACIFHNSRVFAGGYGCALHVLALAEGARPHETKPDVCWQLPLRRQFREVDRGDGTTYTETTLGEYVRAGWGPGGHDLDWYCSSNTEAHVGMEPVYVANRDELVALMGEASYAILAERAESYLDGGAWAPHPAG